jgi:hypothetical protein
MTPSLESPAARVDVHARVARRGGDKGLKIKSEKDFWSGVMFIVVGAAFAWGATEYSFGSSARPGPAYFPFGLGILLAVLGAAVLLQALRTGPADGDPIGAWPFKPALWILGAIVIFGLLLPRLGMVLTLPILIAVASVGGGEFRWKEVLANCVLLTLFSWAVFIKGLGLTIPLWPTFLGN